MKTYKGVVVFRYYQEVTVEVEDDEGEDEAKSAMYEAFQQHRADSESEILDLEEVK